MPVASNDTANVTETIGEIPVLANDTFGLTDHQPGIVIARLLQRNGYRKQQRNTERPDRRYDRLYPECDFNGSDSFTYTITDSNGDTHRYGERYIAPDALD
ncbi:Ig-like domain-containing protein [Flavobacterium pallidum]|uniref:Uncharacterized protein n=1 Tax=Flavobacterium pallidum TaxID=2172098 RepID=A0A2S1SDF7_9FLAO|nr:Ig-like domain-containing protein [Flavobacterium pallidum]AWI24427.1 hypothetical protein HYN49_00145 [Flavobacterium pallidum]